LSLRGGDWDRLLQLAGEARERAYAPYSGFRVGVALQAEDGSVHTGCNVENASYGLTLCAERTALTTAVSAGSRRFSRIALSTRIGPPVSPCGACRQVLAEFSPELLVCSEAEGVRSFWRLDELLPARFSRDSLEEGGGEAGVSHE
jgi:cytidine deaminase